MGNKSAKQPQQQLQNQPGALGPLSGPLPVAGPACPGYTAVPVTQLAVTPVTSYALVPNPQPVCRPAMQCTSCTTYTF